MSQPTSGISAAQAQLFIALLQAQSQSMAAAMSTDAGATDATGSSSDFASLLTSALTGASPYASADATSVGGSGANSWGSAMLGGSATGNRIASTATQLATDLRGPNFASYDANQTPAAAQAAWNTPGWGNGNIQCVAFVDGAFRQAGITLPATPNGADFWATYRGQPGWSEVANGAGLPQPGDIIAFAGGAQGFGHVAVVTGVTPPTNGQPGRVTFAQSNSPSPVASLAIAADGTVTAWPGYRVQGFIRANG